MNEARRRERALVLGPLAVPAVALVGYGLVRGRPAATFAGSVLLGFAVNLVARPGGRSR